MIKDRYEVKHDYTKIPKQNYIGFNYKDICQGIGRAFKFWRIERLYKQADVAKFAGVPKSTITNIETGRSSMRIKDLYRICKYNSIDLSIIINGKKIDIWDHSMWSHWASTNGKMVELRMVFNRMLDQYGISHDYDRVTEALMEYQDSIEGGLATPDIGEYCRAKWGEKRV